MKKKILTLFMIGFLCALISFHAYAGEEEVAEVEALIEEADDAASILEARSAYEALSSADKLEVSNLDVLEEAENSLASGTEAETIPETVAEETEAEEESSLVFGDGLTIDEPATENADDVYYYAFNLAQTDTVTMAYDDSSEDTKIIFIINSEEYEVDSNTTKLEELKLTWDTNSLKITSDNPVDAYYIIETSFKASYTVPLIISVAEEESEETEEEKTIVQQYGGLIFLALIIIFFLYFFILRNRGKKKRKEMKKKSNDQEMDEIRMELRRMNFHDYGYEEKEIKEEREDIINHEIDSEDAYEELEDGTSALHGSFEENIKKYLEKEEKKNK